MVEQSAEFDERTRHRPTESVGDLLSKILQCLEEWCEALPDHRGEGIVPGCGRLLRFGHALVGIGNRFGGVDVGLSYILLCLR